MSFKNVVGQDRTVHLLQNGLRFRRIAHAYCFAGPKGVGKEQTAWQLAKALNCREMEDDACDHCLNCRRIEHGNYPEVMMVAPEGQTIKIDQMRQLQKNFSYSPATDVTRVIIIQDAEKMTVQAANSLLKFLEEPTSRMVAVLLTTNANAILPTIRSRCQMLSFQALSPIHIAKALEKEGVEMGLARVAAHLSSGLDHAREQVTQEGFALLCERVIKWSGEIVSGSSEALVTIQTLILAEAGREQVETSLDLLLLWMRDILQDRVGRNVEPVMELWSDIRRHQSSQWTSSRLMHGMNAVMNARRQLAGPLQPQAILEQMVLAIQGGTTNVISRRSSFQASG